MGVGWIVDRKCQCENKLQSLSLAVARSINNRTKLSETSVWISQSQIPQAYTEERKLGLQFTLVLRMPFLIALNVIKYLENTLNSLIQKLRDVFSMRTCG